MKKRAWLQIIYIRRNVTEISEATLAKKCESRIGQCIPSRKSISHFWSICCTGGGGRVPDCVSSLHFLQYNSSSGNCCHIVQMVSFLYPLKSAGYFWGNEENCDRRDIERQSWDSHQMHLRRYIAWWNHQSCISTGTQIKPQWLPSPNFRNTL